MKKLGVLLCLVVFLSFGCAASALRLSSGDIKALQTAPEGKSTNGCIMLNLLGTSGFVGGASKAIITWGTIPNDAMKWCIER